MSKGTSNGSSCPVTGDETTPVEEADDAMFLDFENFAGSVQRGGDVICQSVPGVKDILSAEYEVCDDTLIMSCDDSIDDSAVNSGGTG